MGFDASIQLHVAYCMEDHFPYYRKVAKVKENIVYIYVNMTETRITIS